MRWIWLLVGLLIFSNLPAHAGHSAPKIFLRINIQSPGEGQSDLEVTTMRVPPDNEEIQVRALPEVTEADLIDVQSLTDGGTRLQFNHAGTVALNVSTAQNQDRIMVVTINGYVVYAPVIDEQISDGSLVIPHPLPAMAIQLLKEEAQQNVRKAART